MPETFEQRPASRLAAIQINIATCREAGVKSRLLDDAAWILERLEECAAALRDVRSWSSEQMPFTIGVAADQALAKLGGPDAPQEKPE